MYTTLIAVDITDFTNHQRDADAQHFLRQRLYEILERACEVSSIPWWDCHREDRGDGALIVTPPTVRSADATDPLLHHLAQLLRRANRLASSIGRLRLRLAVHAGEVSYDTHGVVGPSVNYLFRLLDAPEFKDVVATSSTDLAGLVSEQLFHSLAAAAGLNPDAYNALKVSNKGIDACGYLWLPPTYPAAP